MPFAATTFVIASLASMGMPGFSGFPAELSILIGTWSASPWWTFAAAVGVLIAAAFTLRVMQLAFFGRTETVKVTDPTYAPLTWPERTGACLLLGTTILLGLKPDILLNWIEPALRSPMMSALMKGLGS